MKHESLFRIAQILLGNGIYAIAVTFFILPAGLITGGTAGIGLFVQYHTGLPLSVFVTGFNIVMFLAGFLLLGRSFALTTLVSTFAYPVFLRLSEGFAARTGALTTDPLLCTIFGGLLIGVGIALVVQQGASTGGMDIPPLILQKYTGLSMTVSLYAFDVLILLLQVTFSNREQVLYGILLVCTYTLVLEQLLLTGKSRIQLQIISEQYEAINQLILHRLDRGTTLMEIEGGFTRRETYAILTVVSRRELFRISKAVQQLDPNAFMVVTQVREVRGREFTSQKRHLTGFDG